MGTCFDIILHYGGRWQNANEMVYEGGQVEKLDSVDVDYILYFTLWDYFVEVRCERGERMWLRNNGLSGNEGIEEIVNDVDACNMVYYNSRYGSIGVFMNENDPQMAVLLGEVAGIQGYHSMGNIRISMTSVGIT